jgi:hypothetical protein
MSPFIFRCPNTGLQVQGPLEMTANPPSHRWRRRLLLDEHLVQLPEIAVIQEAAQHVRWDLTRTHLVEPTIGTR